MSRVPSWHGATAELNTGIVLLVDDNPTNLAVLSQALKRDGFKIRVAVDGESAIEQVKEDAPDLILLDIQMPGIDGFETCRRLKEDPAIQNIPIIFITASADTETKVNGLSIGAVDYITKPFQQEEVLARVRVHLKIRFLTEKVKNQAIALERANQELQRLAYLDGLTQVANRRWFDQHLEQEWRKSMRDRRPLSLILCDIDYFKNYNDFYGHQAGDYCLQQVASALQEALQRPTDFVARYGGEEFAIVLSETPAEGAIHIAEVIQSKVKKLAIAHEKSQASSVVTLSLGISSCIPNIGLQPTELLAASDKALYNAKGKGRNTYCFEALYLNSQIQTTFPQNQQPTSASTPAPF